MSKELYPEYGELSADIQEILISEAEIQARIAEIGQAISTDYLGKNPVLIGVLKGMFVFMADLLRAVKIPVDVDFMAVSIYSPQEERSGAVRLIKDLDIPITGRHVLFIEDVIDTGLTLNYLLQNLQSRKPASLSVCVLLNKPEHRFIDIPLKYRGFDIPDRFVVGYGLDYREKYRNLPFIGLLKGHVLQNHTAGK